MPYELVHPEGEEIPKAPAIADMEKLAAERASAEKAAGGAGVFGTTPDEGESGSMGVAGGVQAVNYGFAYATYGESVGDSGYTDAFHTLKAKMDFTKQQYLDQLASLPVRKEKLRKELIWKWFSVVLYLIIIPVGFWIITGILMNLGVKSGLMGILYLVFKVAMFPVIFICVFFLFPPAVRSAINVQRRSNAFNNPNAHAGYRDKLDIVSFADEEHFLRQRLDEFNEFEKRIRRENLDQPGGGEEVIDQSDMSPKQKETIELMQTMSIFRDYQARIGTGRVEGDSKYVAMGLVLGVIIGLAAFATIVN